MSLHRVQVALYRGLILGKLPVDILRSVKNPQHIELIALYAEIYAAIAIREGAQIRAYPMARYSVYAQLRQLINLVNQVTDKALRVCRAVFGDVRVHGAQIVLRLGREYHCPGLSDKSYPFPVMAAIAASGSA